LVPDPRRIDGELRVVEDRIDGHLPQDAALGERHRD
jgi:hypothetical protein